MHIRMRCNSISIKNEYKSMDENQNNPPLPRAAILNLFRASRPVLAGAQTLTGRRVE